MSGDSPMTTDREMPMDDESVEALFAQLSDKLNTQVAPYPDELQDLVNNCVLDPGWDVHLVKMDRGQGSYGLTLRIVVTAFDTYHPGRGRRYRVQHFFPVPAASYGRRSWQRWLFDRYIDVLKHEGAEMFQVGGERPYAPHHYDGADPYVVFETTKSERLARPGSPDPNIAPTQETDPE